MGRPGSQRRQSMRFVGGVGAGTEPEPQQTQTDNGAEKEAPCQELDPLNTYQEQPLSLRKWMRWHNCKTYQLTSTGETYPSIRPTIARCNPEKTLGYIDDSMEANQCGRMFQMGRDDVLAVWNQSPHKETLRWYGIGESSTAYSEAVAKSLKAASVQPKKPKKKSRIGPMEKVKDEEPRGAYVLDRLCLKAKLDKMPNVRRQLKASNALSWLHCPTPTDPEHPFEPQSDLPKFSLMTKTAKPRKHGLRRKHWYCPPRESPVQGAEGEKSCMDYETFTTQPVDCTKEEAAEEKDKEPEPRNYEELYKSLESCFVQDPYGDAICEAYVQCCKDPDEPAQGCNEFLPEGAGGGGKLDKGADSDGVGKGKKGHGDGDGDGKGDGREDGEGDGHGKGDAEGDGKGKGKGFGKDGKGDGKDGRGDGKGDGRGYGRGYGKGDGRGDGKGDGKKDGKGDGKKDGKGDGQEGTKGADKDGKGDGQGEVEEGGKGAGKGGGKGDDEGDGKGGGKGGTKGDGKGGGKGDGKGGGKGEAKGDGKGDRKGDAKPGGEGDQKGHDPRHFSRFSENEYYKSADHDSKNKLDKLPELPTNLDELKELPPLDTEPTKPIPADGGGGAGGAAGGAGRTKKRKGKKKRKRRRQKKKKCVNEECNLGKDKDYPCEICCQVAKEPDSPLIKEMRLRNEERELRDYLHQMRHRQYMECKASEYPAPQHKCQDIECDSRFCGNRRMQTHFGRVQAIQQLQQTLKRGNRREYQSIAKDLDCLLSRLCNRLTRSSPRG